MGACGVAWLDAGTSCVLCAATKRFITFQGKLMQGMHASQCHDLQVFPYRNCTAPQRSGFSMGVASALIRPNNSTTYCFNLKAVDLHSPSICEQFDLRDLEWDVGVWVFVQRMSTVTRHGVQP